MYKKRLKELREENSLTQNEVAKAINISRGSYGPYENENDVFNIKHLEAISNFFNVSIDYLLCLTNQINYKNISSCDIIKSAQRLKEFRKNNKITQVTLAKDLNIAKGTIANYECARNLIATSFLYDICTKYNISADYLLGRIDFQPNLK